MPFAFLTRIDSDKNMRRWYTVGVQPTLFHRVAVVCGWGRLHTAYQRWRIIPAESWTEAEELAAQVVESKVKKGYTAANWSYGRN